MLVLGLLKWMLGSRVWGVGSLLRIRGVHLPFVTFLVLTLLGFVLCPKIVTETCEALGLY